MSCQSLAARAFTDNGKEMTHCTTFHRSVRFSSDSRGSGRATNDADNKKEASGSISLTALTPPVSTQCHAMSQSAPSNSLNFDLDDSPGPPQSCRFPKLEECAHFHYERVALGGLNIEVVPCEDSCTDECEEGWICLRVRSHVVSGASVSASASGPSEEGSLTLHESWCEPSDVCEWTLTRSRDNLLRLDDILHRCIYDRKVSGLPNLSTELVSSMDTLEYTRLIADYMHHLSIIADDSINCGSALNWLQMDNKGHKLLVANEDSSSINTPAVAAAYSVRKYISQARDEISFDVGDMISIIDMPGPQESLWWRGKRGFRVGFFPHHCVAVIGDKVPRNMTQPPPIVGSVAVAPIKPVLRKHGKLISLFRSFILSRPSRRSLKQQGILRERVFGCDLGEHLLNCGHDVPLVLVECAAAIECRGAVDGVYRLSGGSGLTQRLRSAFDSGAAPDLSPASPELARDPHAVPSLLKMYFRELPNPLCTYQLYETFVAAVQLPDEVSKLKAVRQTVVKLPPPHYRTLSYLMVHLRRISSLGGTTGMTPRNMAIVWAPNLLRAPRHHHALQGVAVQAVVTEFLICYAEELFAQEQGADSEPESLEPERVESQVELRGMESCRRPKSLPVNPPTKLLSLEEARRRGLPSGAPPLSPPSALPPPSGAIAAAAELTLRPQAHLKPKYIEVGSGPNNLPQYHTVLDLPLSGTKRGLKRSPSGWRGLFSRSHKQQRPRGARPVALAVTHPQPVLEEDVPMVGAGTLRPVKSCESLASDTDTLAPLAERASAPLKHHTRSSSCDSYFEPWQTELADMRLRLSPQERDYHMFSEEDDTQLNIHPCESVWSSPPESAVCSVDPSPRRNLRVDIEAASEVAEQRRLALEEQLSSIGYIDGESPRPRVRAPPEKRHSARPPSPTNADLAKRLCKDRDSPKSSQSDFQTSLGNVKLRERSSPRKSKSSRYTNLHYPAEPNEKTYSRLSWHGKDGHATLIKIDWPENPSLGLPDNLGPSLGSTINSSPVTPITPSYDPLETDSEVTENKHTIKIGDCLNCNETVCLKCELKATDYNHTDTEASLHSEVSYQNLNRLSNVSTSSSDQDKLKAMTSSHESTSSYSNSRDDYETYNFRPNYINLSEKSSPGSPLKSPLKSTISITFRSPTKDVQTDRDSVYEDIDLEKNLSIVEEASVPQTDASLPTQQACQPELSDDLIILETPPEPDVYSQVKFFKKSIEEVNAMILESPDKDVMEESVFLPEESDTDDVKHRRENELHCDVVQVNEDTEDDVRESMRFMIESSFKHKNHYENVQFKCNDYENINVDTLKICDKLEIKESVDSIKNGNSKKAEPKNINVRELAIRFESPTEQKGPFVFDKFKAEVKYPSLERKDVNHPPLVKKEDRDNTEIKDFRNHVSAEFKHDKKDNFNNTNTELKENTTIDRERINRTSERNERWSLSERRERNDDIVRVTIKNDAKLSPKSYKLCKNSARSLDENAFIKEFGSDKNRRKSLEVHTKNKAKYLPDLNLNTVTSESKEQITPTTENKISLIQYDKPEIKIPFDTEKKLSRERIEKYKEERRNFLREKYSSQSFRSNPEQLTRIKIKKEEVKEELPKFERRNTVDLGQRLRFSLAKSANNLDDIHSPTSPDKDTFERKDKISPSLNIKDMAALFEQKQNPN